MIYGYKENETKHGFFSLKYDHEPKSSDGILESYFSCEFDSSVHGKIIRLPINVTWNILCDKKSNFNIPEEGFDTLFFEDIEVKYNIKSFIKLSLNEYEKEAQGIISKADSVINSDVAFSTLKNVMLNRKILAEKQLENVNALRILLGDEKYGA